MIYWEWKLVYDILAEYGFKRPLLELGGTPYPALPDYLGEVFGKPAYVRPVGGVLWADLQIDYKDSHNAQELAEDESEAGRYGTIISVSVLEHVTDPFSFFRAIHTLLHVDGLAIVSTFFKWPLHGDFDFWRFTHLGLRRLADQAGLYSLAPRYIGDNVLRQPVYIVVAKKEKPERRWPKNRRPELEIVRYF